MICINLIRLPLTAVHVVDDLDKFSLDVTSISITVHRIHLRCLRRPSPRTTCILVVGKKNSERGLDGGIRKLQRVAIVYPTSKKNSLTQVPTRGPLHKY